MDDIPDLSGRTAVVTGVTGGLGLHTARHLARAGATVIGTARNADKAAATLERVRREFPSADVRTHDLDLADLAGVRASAEKLRSSVERIDILINNAGIMIPPKAQTVDGFELQIGTNHLGHFAWTAQIWPLLREPGTRIVQVSSIAHSLVKGIDLRSLTPAGSPRRYRRMTSYGESKLANLLFARELDRRIAAAGLDIASVAAHPGYAATNLASTGTSLNGANLFSAVAHGFTRVVGQSAESGAQPLLMAATDPTLAGGAYTGPGGFKQVRGRPRTVGMTSTASDPEWAENVWAASEAATELTFEVA